MKTVNGKVYVEWPDVRDYIKAVSTNFKKQNIKPTGVYGIPRGGLIFAVMLSHEMHIPMLLAPTEGCVVIDDIADSGRTLMHFTENDTNEKKYFITTMYYHKRSAVIPDFYFLEKGNDWIVYPYEMED